MTLATNWVDNIGMFVNAAYLNQLGTEVNADTYARPLADTFANRPAAAASNNGALYFCTDNGVLYRSNGSAWSAVSIGVANGIAEPPTSGWTAVNAGSATSAADLGGRLMTIPSASGINWRLETRTLSPTSNYRFTVRLDAAFTPAGTARAGIALRNSSSGSFVVCGLYWDGTGHLQLYANKFNSATAFNSNYGGITYADMLYGIPSWLRIRDDGTNRYFEYSYNGIDWINLYTSTRTDFITPDQVAWGGSNEGTGFNMLLRARSWSVA